MAPSGKKFKRVLQRFSAQLHKLHQVATISTTDKLAGAGIGVIKFLPGARGQVVARSCHF